MPASSSYNRIQMFGNLENGVYRYGQNLRLYGTNFTETPPLNPLIGNKYTHVGITKNGSTNKIKVYINGNFHKEFTDNSAAFILQADKKFTFFKDNGNEDNVANVAYINVANYVQTNEEISQLFKNNITVDKSYTYHFLDNTYDFTLYNKLHILSENYQKNTDIQFGVDRKNLFIEQNNSINFKNESLLDQTYHLSFYYDDTLTNSKYKLISFDNEESSTSIYIQNNQLFFGEESVGIDLNRNSSNEEINSNYKFVSIQRDQSSNKIEIFVNGRRVFEYFDLNENFTFNSDDVITFFDLINSDKVYLDYLHISNKVYNESKIEDLYNEIKPSDIKSVFNFNQNLSNEDNTSKLQVSSLDQSHIQNNFIYTDVCNTMRYLYQINPKTKINYNNGLGFNYKNFTINLYLNRIGNEQVNLFKLNNNQTIVSLSGNYLSIHSPVGVNSFELKSPNYSHLISIVKSAQENKVFFYDNSTLIGSLEDNDIFIIDDSGDINFFDNTIDQTFSPLLLGHLSVINKVYNKYDIIKLMNSVCKILINETYQLQGNLDSEMKTSQLSLINDVPIEFYIDKNLKCGDLRTFVIIPDNNGLIYNYKEFAYYEDYSIEVYYKKNNQPSEKHKVLEINTFPIFVEGDKLYINNTIYSIESESYLIYNLFQITRNNRTKELKVYLNGKIITTILDTDDLYIFSEKNNLVFFNDKEVSVGKVSVTNFIKDSSIISEEFKAFCKRTIDRIFPMFMNLSDSTGENTFQVTSYNGEHRNNKFISDNVINCGVSRSIYYVADNAGLIFNDGIGELYEDYTISLYFRLNPYLGSWARLIDFSDGKLDAGIYRLADGLNFYPNGNVGNGLLSNSHEEYTLLTLSRDSKTNIITVYINGKKASTYNDSQGLYKVPQNGNILFIKDDIVVKDEQSPTNIAYIRVSNKILTDDEITEVYDNLCTSIACTQSPNLNGETIPSLIGISTQERTIENWPSNINGGNLVLESKDKGFVIPRISSVNTSFGKEDLVEGMIYFDKDMNCLKLYDGTDWRCVTASCVK